jgi:hypothetical protein
MSRRLVEHSGTHLRTADGGILGFARTPVGDLRVDFYDHPLDTAPRQSALLGGERAKILAVWLARELGIVR